MAALKSTQETAEQSVHTATVAQFAALHGLKPVRVRRLIRRGQLPAVRLMGSRLWLIVLNELQYETNVPAEKQTATEVNP